MFGESRGHLNHIQGGFFNWTPPKLSKYKFLYKLWHLEKFRASLHGILYLENLGGGQLKKPPCRMLINHIEIYLCPDSIVSCLDFFFLSFK